MKPSTSFNKLITIFIFTSILLVCFQQVRKIKPFEVQKLLPESHPIRLRYEEYNKQYDDENKIFILVKSKEKLSSKLISNYLKSLNKVVKYNGKIRSNSNLLNAKFINFDEHGFQLKPFIEKSEWTRESKNKLKTDFWRNSLISQDQKSLLITFSISSKTPRKERVPLVKEIIQEFHYLHHKFPQLDFHFLGTEVANFWFTKEMFKNLLVISPILLMIIGFFFLCIFNSLHVVFLSYAVIIASYASMVIIITLIEKGIGPYSSFALFFVAIVATSDLVHFFTSFQRHKGKIQETIASIKKPCFLTSLTTAIGFSSLVFNENVPVRYFGLYCATGTFIAYAMTFYFLPLLIKSFTPKIPTQEIIRFNIDKIWDFTLRYSKTILFSFTALTLLFIWKTSSLRIDDNLYKKFIEKHPMSSAVDNFSQGLNFVGSIDITIQSKKDKIISNAVIPKIKDFEDDLLKLETSSHIKSFTQFHDNISAETKDSSSNRISALLNTLFDYGALNSFYKESSNEIRTILFLKSLNSQALEKTILDIKELAKKYPDFNIDVNGFASIRNYINQNVIRDFIKSFSISLILIFILFLFLFKSLKWGLIAMLPNLFPLLTISGLMGLFNITMESNLVILVSITIGIAVDDTIHFIYKLRSNLAAGSDLETSIKAALDATFNALVMTTVVLSLTFPVFFMAELKLFVQVGAFILLSLVAALLADFLLLPVILIKLGIRK